MDHHLRPVRSRATPATAGRSSAGRAASGRAAPALSPGRPREPRRWGPGCGRSSPTGWRAAAQAVLDATRDLFVRISAWVTRVRSASVPTPVPGAGGTGTWGRRFAGPPRIGSGWNRGLVGELMAVSVSGEVVDVPMAVRLGFAAGAVWFVAAIPQPRRRPPRVRHPPRAPRGRARRNGGVRLLPSAPP